MLDFHLFSFVPVLLLSGILWIERILRKGPKKKNRFSVPIHTGSVFGRLGSDSLGRNSYLGNPEDLNYPSPSSIFRSIP
jgi:hypothetical protein